MKFDDLPQWFRVTFHLAGDSNIEISVNVTAPSVGEAGTVAMNHLRQAIGIGDVSVDGVVILRKRTPGTEQEQ